MQQCHTILLDAKHYARRDLILWLVRVYPQDPILSSSYATLNAADVEGTASIKQKWLNAVKQYPDDDLVIRRLEPQFITELGNRLLIQ